MDNTEKNLKMCANPVLQDEICADPLDQLDRSISQIESLQHVTVFKDGTPTFLSDPFKRIDDIARLENGWFDGKGERLDKNDSEILKKWLAELLRSSNIPAPFVYPKNDG